ncbi:acyl-CoA-like ligand-binding transcription factor [Actinophytocola algeriensis]|uniref:AcrR family transcriptional regulator n=1 Tax=Actinophytocola algeriensis TaxID=1768010 RepID=A0A7W7Q9J4_9PSEU|nr:TetR family transcriptional regulator [Actinophytocola algeriensis]MBB4909398.1 AcrR family transcriptional regulator [Actinophytocola algeriensis]MBE1475388.1 AcrR family transcriptional regulator [Actinophytocola algeriensis]
MESDDVPSGLRERKKRETRIALSWAAIRLTVERGFDNVRVEDIAAEAGVSPRTFNNYFAGKGEAIAARQVERARAIAEELRARPADEPLWEAITNAALARFALGQDSHREPADQQWVEGVRLMVSEPALQGEFLKAAAAVEAEFAAVVAERTGTDPELDLYPKLVAAAVGGAMAVAVEHWLRTEPPGAVTDLLRDAFAQLSQGLPTPRRTT